MEEPRQRRLPGAQIEMASRQRGTARERTVETDMKRFEEQRRKLKRAANWKRAVERAMTVVNWIVVVVGAGMVAVLIAGAVLLEQVEVCRYPSNVYTETFTYTIDIAATALDLGVSGAKLTKVTGMKIDSVNVFVNFGTVTLVGDTSTTATALIMSVSNRALDPYYGPRQTYMQVSTIQVTKYNTTELRSVINIYSNTSNSLVGDVSCRRADYTITIPVLCLLDDTKMLVTVTTGDITAQKMASANLDTLSLTNTVGTLTAQQVNGYRVNMYTGTGIIAVKNCTAHYLLLSGKTDGSVITASDVVLFSGDIKSTCQQTVYYVPGYPQYPQMQVVCNQELGILTLDSRGGDGPRVALTAISGGNIVHTIKVGDTVVSLTACYDFAGTFTIIDPFGLVQFQQKESPGAYGRPRLYYKILKKTAGGTITGEICGLQSGGGVAGNQTMTINVETTGAVNMIIFRPALLRSSATSGTSKRGFAYQQTLIDSATNSILSAALGN